MKQVYQTSVPQDGQNNLPSNSEGQKKLTNRILRLVERKELASALGVSEGLVSRWSSGEKPIPTERVFEIIKAGKLYCREVQTLENEIDLMMMLNFGCVE